MHLNRALLNWGVFFILLGAIPLAVRQGLIPEATVARAWTLWPLLLIAAGIGLVLRRTELEFVGGIVTAATLGIIGGGLLASGGLPFGSCGDEEGAVAFPAQQGRLAGTATVDVRLNCGQLTVGTAPGPWKVEGADKDGSPPRIEATPSTEAASSLKISSSDRSGFDFFGSRDRWTISLPTDSKIDLRTTLNAGEAVLSLGQADLTGLQLQVNAGKATVDLSAVIGIGAFDLHLNAGDGRIALPNVALKGSVEANAGTVRLCPPAGAGLRIRMNDNITAANNFAERGLTETSKNVWETTGFASAGVQLEITAQVNAGALSVEPAGGCGA